MSLASPERARALIKAVKGRALNGNPPTAHQVAQDLSLSDVPEVAEQLQNSALTRCLSAFTASAAQVRPNSSTSSS